MYYKPASFFPCYGIRCTRAPAPETRSNLGTGIALEGEITTRTTAPA